MTIDPTTAAQVAIGRLQAAYGDAVTRRAWADLVPMFTPTCEITLDLRNGTTLTKTGGAEIGTFIAQSIERFEFFMFTVVNAYTTVHDESSASARVYIRELRQDRDNHEWSTAYGLYRDEYRSSAGHWQFSRREYASLARSAPDGNGMLVFDIP
jgi:hypothetical protein